MLVGAIRLAHGFWRGFLLLVPGVAFFVRRLGLDVAQVGYVVLL